MAIEYGIEKVMKLIRPIAVYLWLSVLCIYYALGGIDNRCFAQPTPVCAHVQIQISQDAVLTRSTFRATLQLTNNSTSPIKQVFVALQIEDTNGIPVNNFFAIPQPQLTGINDIHGNGMIMPGVTGTAIWTLIPTDDAAPTAVPMTYTVGGQMTYSLNGGLITVPLYPTPIKVFPNPSLFLKYFLQHDVFSDNPFTLDVVEPAEPCSLGLMATNAGLGIAKNFQITTNQPQIIDNDRGLPLAPHIIGTQVGSQAVSPSLTVNLGDMAPNAVRTARWLLTTAYQGQFTGFNATYMHTTGLNTNTHSLIDGIQTFWLEHVIRIDDPTDDQIPDFLVDGEAGGNPKSPPAPLPTAIHSSDGSVLSVFSITDATMDGIPSMNNVIVHVTANVANAGWNFIRTDNLAAGTSFKLGQVQRSDGRIVRLTDNAWTTDRTITPSTVEHRLYIVDKLSGTGPVTYSLTFVPPLQVANVVISDGLHQRSNITSLAIAFTTDTNIPQLIKSGTVNQAISLRRRGTTPAPISLTTNRYAWDVQNRTLTIDLTSDGQGGSNQTMLTTDANYELQMNTGAITSFLTGVPLMDTDGIADSVFRFGATASDSFFRLAGDANGDRLTNFADLQLVNGSLNHSVGDPAFNPDADLNSDGTVNMADRQIVISNMSHSMPFE